MVSALMAMQRVIAPKNVPPFLVQLCDRYAVALGEQWPGAVQRPDSLYPATPLLRADPVLWAFDHLLTHAEVSHPLEVLQGLCAGDGLPEDWRVAPRYRVLVEEESPTFSIANMVREGGIVTGFLPRVTDTVLDHMRERTYRKLNSVVDRVRASIAQSPQHLQGLFAAALPYFTTRIEYTHAERIPSTGRLVFACTHPFPFVDDFSLMLCVTGRFPDRPWAFIANTNSLTTYLPGWRDDPHFTEHIFGLEREGGTTWGRVTNGRQVVDRSIQFLQAHPDGMFFIAPEGPDAVCQDRIAQPHLGFATIAASADAQIIPVVFTGAADLDCLAYAVHGEFLAPYAPQALPILTANMWIDTVCAALDMYGYFTTW